MAQELGSNSHINLPEKVLSAAESSAQKIREAFLEALGHLSANEQSEFVNRSEEITHLIARLARDKIDSLKPVVLPNRLNVFRPEEFLEILRREGYPTHRVKEAVRQISSCIFQTKKRCAAEIGISLSHLVNWLNDKANFSEETEQKAIDCVYRTMRDRIQRGRPF